MAFWVLWISCVCLVLGRKHADPLDLLDLNELKELKRAYEKELAVGHWESEESDSSELLDSSSEESESSSSDYLDSLEDSDEDSLEEDSEDAVGLQDKDGWIIYPEWSKWDPLGNEHGYHPVEEDKPVAAREPRHRSRHRHRRPRRRYRRRSHRSRRRPRRRRRERSVGRSQSRRHHHRRGYYDDYAESEVKLGSGSNDRYDLDDLLDSADLDLNDFFDSEDLEEAVGSDSSDLFDLYEGPVGSKLLALDSERSEFLKTLQRLLDSEEV